MSQSKKNFLSEALVRKTIENLETNVEQKVKTLRKSQYKQLAVEPQIGYSIKKKRGLSASNVRVSKSKLRVNYANSL